MRRSNAGFTLIELVIVIVILGVLSAFALPRFADLGGDARAASIEGAAGAVRSASSIVRSACAADSDCDVSSDDDSITLEGGSIDVAYGAPIATSNLDSGDPLGILTAAQISSEDYNISGVDGTNVTVAIDEDSNSEGDDACFVTYNQASGTDDGEGASFEVDVSGC